MTKPDADTRIQSASQAVAIAMDPRHWMAPFFIGAPDLLRLEAYSGLIDKNNMAFPLMISIDLPPEN